MFKRTEGTRLVSAIRLIGITSGFLLLGIAACGNPELPTAVVNALPSGDAPEVIPLSVEVVELNNCGGNNIVTQRVEVSRSVSNTIEMSGGQTLSAGGSVGVLGVGELQIQAEISRQHGVTFGQEESVSRSLTYSAENGTNMRFTIRHSEVWEHGEVSTTSEDKSQTRPYRIRKDFKMELVRSEDLGCPQAGASAEYIAIVESGRSVPGNPIGWIDTGLTISAGNTLQISASGSIQFDTAGRTVDPNGNPDGDPPGSNTLVPTVASHTLVARIGSSGSLIDLSGFLVGSQFNQVVGTSGKLFLGFNDGYVKQDRSGLDVGGVGDNSGSYSANITILR